MRWFYVLAAGYAAASGLLALAIGRPQVWAVPHYLSIWPFKMLGTCVVLLAWFGVYGLTRDWRRPITGARVFLSAMTKRHVAHFVVFSLVLFVFYGSFTTVKTLIPHLVPFYADPMLADLDTAIHGAVPFAVVDGLLRGSFLDPVIPPAYTYLWGTLWLAMPLAVALFSRFEADRRRFFVTFALSWIVLGNLAALAFSSAGPVFYAEVTGDAARFAEARAHIDATYAGWPIKPHLWLWEAYSSGSGELAAGISAFPSLHVAMAMLYCLVLWNQGRAARIAGLAFLVLTMVGSVRLGWHYAVDGYASMLFVSAVWYGPRARMLRRIVQPVPHQASLR